MKLTGFTAVVVVLLCLPASSFAAEDYPKAEIFGGYSFLLADTPVDSMNLHGWNASVAGNITSWLGVVGDFSGHYGSPSVFGFNIPFVDVRAHSFLFGPKLAYRGNDKITPFGHFLIGVTRVDALGFGDQAFAGAIGGGLDVRLSDSLAIRAFQADYFMTRFDEGPWNDNARQNNFRLSAGIVLRF